MYLMSVDTFDPIHMCVFKQIEVSMFVFVSVYGFMHVVRVCLMFV